MGEKLDALEPFHPDRMASRILGMGDILSLIEKIQSTTDLAKALEMEKKLRKDEFTLEQFLEQMQQVKKMGSLETISCGLTAALILRSSSISSSFICKRPAVSMITVSQASENALSIALRAISTGDT